jgi:hypothetical protein
MPVATQWEVVEEAAEVIKPPQDELIRQAAQGEVLHNDDTSMRVLHMEREPSDERTGVFTSGIVSTASGRKIALYFTGRQLAGENLADVLKRRAEILLANCLADGRRQFVEIASNFPDEGRHVLESLGSVYRNDKQARERKLSPEERLRFHLEHSAPAMRQLPGWLEAQLAEKKTEPNSGLGKPSPIRDGTGKD